MFIPLAFRGALLIFVLQILTACSQSERTQDPLRAVKVMTVGQGAAQFNAEFSGEVRARVESSLGFRVAGKISQRPVQLGQHVKAGQLLAQLDPQDYQLSVDAARAQLAAAATQRDLAQANFKRYQDLRAQGFISSAELERHASTQKSAQAQWEQAQAQLSGQSNQARYTRLVAEVSGVVTMLAAEAGQVVSAGMPVLRIAQDGPRDVVIAVPEDKVRALRVGTSAQVRAWAQPDVLPAVVREVAASADPVTRTFAVKVALDAPHDLPLGSTASVTLDAFAPAGTALIKLPGSALRKDGDRTAVWVLDTQTMTVQPAAVDIAGADGNDWLVRAGLRPGMQVVSAGVHVLTAGQKVTLYQPLAAAQ